MSFSAASSAEILRSNEKDEQYMFWIRREISEIAQRFSGVGNWLRWRRELDILSDFLYFALTTLSGLQSLGEEYVNIIQVNEHLRSVPSFKRRLLSVLLHISSPFLLKMSFLQLERYLQSTAVSAEQRRLRNQLLEYLPTLQYVVSFLRHFHLSLFYFGGAFYHIAKRITGIRYVFVRRWLGDQTSQRIYRLLGVLSMTQLLISGGLQCYSFYCSKVFSSAGSCPKTTEEIEVVEAKDKCCLCLGKRRYATATPCGHLFCWYCIMEWIETKKMCPLCREEFPTSRLVFLQNFS